MTFSSQHEVTIRLGADRVIEPVGALPRSATRLEAGGPIRSSEIEIDVELLCLDKTSFEQLTGSASSSSIESQIAEIVDTAGKMQNPVTESGGILLGRVKAVGDEVDSPPDVGDQVVGLASLTLIPLRLESVGPVRSSAQVPVKGTAYLSPSLPWVRLPGDLSVDAVVDLLDVCAAASQVRELIKQGDTVCVFGAGHAGMLSMATARDVLGDTGKIVALDTDESKLDEALGGNLCDVALKTDLRDAIGTLQALREAGVGAADVTIVVVSVTGCEATAILATADTGSILFFSMATSFSAAALTSDGLGSNARMIIGSGFSSDYGEYAISLMRTNPALAKAFGNG